MHRRDVGWDNSLRRALAAAGLVEGYEHGCRAHRCGWRGRSTQRERPALCPQCGRPSTWSKPIPRHLTFKDLRHTTATLLLKAGAPLATVQRLLRHSDPKLTAMIYGHLETDDLRRGLERLKLTGGPVSCRQPQPPSPDLPVNGDSIGRTAPELRNGATTEKKDPGVGGNRQELRGLTMVGATGFEPATTCTPSKCATRLRYAPRAAGRG